jgi:hypothetical protein
MKILTPANKVNIFLLKNGFICAILILASCGQEELEKVKIRKRVQDINQKINVIEKELRSMEDSVIRQVHE